MTGLTMAMVRGDQPLFAVVKVNWLEVIR